MSKSIMEFNSQICTTREQSKRLLALGLKRETADMMYQNYRGHCIGFGYDKYPKCITDLNILRDVDIPAWSLHRLLLLLPTEYTYDIDFQRIMQDFVFGSQDMYDEMVSCIETLIEAGYFYEEYLEHI